MGKQTINLGAVANDGTGDTLRVAFDKANDNFDELYADKAPLASPTFTGTPAAPTAAAATNTTQVATTAFVQSELRARADPTRESVLRDDFVTGGTETGEIGCLNWGFANGSVAIETPVENHLGIIKYTTGTTNDQDCLLGPGSGAATAITQFRFEDLIEQTWVFNEAAAAVADHNVRIGVFDTWGMVTANGVYLERLAADTTWFLVTRAAGVQTRTDTTVACQVTDWRKFKLERVNATTVRATINGGTPIEVSTNVPAAATVMGALLAQEITAGVARAIRLDYWSQVMRALTR